MKPPQIWNSDSISIFVLLHQPATQPATWNNSQFLLRKKWTRLNRVLGLHTKDSEPLCWLYVYSRSQPDSRRTARQSQVAISSQRICARHISERIPCSAPLSSNSMHRPSTRRPNITPQKTYKKWLYKRRGSKQSHLHVVRFILELRSPSNTHLQDAHWQS